ncbi:MAG: DsrE family protein [Pyrinomonadaceae bacterium]|nr:DsrE family protein [Pyrinomonadaceae bacterium]
MKKVAIIILSDPKTGSEESVGRLFNALAAVYDFKKRGDDVQILFQGAGTRWVGELVNTKHPAYELFQSVKDKVAGVSCGCADVFGAQDGVAASGFDLITENAVPNTSGLPSLARLTDEGFTILTF